MANAFEMMSLCSGEAFSLLCHPPVGFLQIVLEITTYAFIFSWWLRGPSFER